MIRYSNSPLMPLINGAKYCHHSASILKKCAVVNMRGDTRTDVLQYIDDGIKNNTGYNETIVRILELFREDFVRRSSIDYQTMLDYEIRLASLARIVHYKVLPIDREEVIWLFKALYDCGCVEEDILDIFKIHYDVNDDEVMKLISSVSRYQYSTDRYGNLYI